MDSDLTFASETAGSRIPEDDEELTLVATLSDSDTDTMQSDVLNRLVHSTETPTLDSTKNLSQEDNRTDIFSRQTPHVEAATPLPFSFGKFAPGLISMSKAIVKPSLLFRHCQQAPQTVDNDHAGSANATAVASLHDDTGDDNLSTYKNVTQQAMPDQGYAVSSPSETHHVHSSTPPASRDRVARRVFKRTLSHDDNTSRHRVKRRRLADRHQRQQHVSWAVSTTSQSSSPTPSALFASRSDVEQRRLKHTIHAQRNVSASETAKNQAPNTQMNPVASMMSQKGSISTPGGELSTPVGRHEMKEALQIVAHTWAKAQMSAGQQAQSLAQALYVAEAQVIELTQSLDTANIENSKYAADSTARAEREDGWASKVQQAQRDVQHEAIDLQKDKIVSLNSTIAKLESQLLRRAKHTQKLSKKMMELMHRMHAQTESSQLAAEYLFMQLGEKTGLLVEARDELNTLRARRADTLSTTEQLTTNLEAGQSRFLERMEALHGPLTQTEKMVNKLLTAEDSLESAIQEQKFDSASLKSMLEELVTRFDEWSQSNSKTQPVDTQISDKSLARMNELIGSKIDALKHESTSTVEFHELQKQLTHSTIQITELTSQLSAKEAASVSSRAELDWINSKISWLSDYDGGNLQTGWSRVEDEMIELRELTFIYEDEIGDEQYKKTVVSAQLADSREECDILREQLATANTQVGTASATVAQQNETARSKRAQLESRHAETLSELGLTHEIASKNAREESASELKAVQRQLEQAVQQQSKADELLKVVTAERDDLRDGLRVMADERDLHTHSTPLLEEELAILREQLIAATTSKAENAATLSTTQEKHIAEISRLKADLDSCQQRSNNASATAKQNKIAKDDLSVQVKMLQSSVGDLKTALSKSENDHFRSNELAQQFKCNVDKIWKKEEGKHNSELDALKSAHIQLEAEMLQAENNTVQLTEKLNVAQQTIQTLHALLDKPMPSKQQQHELGSASEHLMKTRSISRSHGRQTPDAVMNELFDFFSKPAGNSTFRSGSQSRETVLAAPRHNSPSLKPGSDMVSNHSWTSTQSNKANRTLLGVQYFQSTNNTHAGVDRQSGIRDARLMNTSQLARRNDPIYGQTLSGDTESFELRHEEDVDNSAHSSSVLNAAPQYGSSQKKQPGGRKDRVDFSDMLLSTTFPQSGYGTPQTSVAKKTDSSKNYRKLKAMARSGRTSMKATDDNKRSRPHLARLSKQKYDERFNQE